MHIITRSRLIELGELHADADAELRGRGFHAGAAGFVAGRPDVSLRQQKPTIRILQRTARAVEGPDSRTSDVPWNPGRFADLRVTR